MTLALVDVDSIGEVIAVDSEAITVRLDESAAGFVKASSAGLMAVGTINSYVVVPAGHFKIVAIVASITMREDRGSEAERFGPITRLMNAIMVGHIREGSFMSGVSTYPALYSPVRMATPDEVGIIFRPPGEVTIRLGEAVVAPDYDVQLDANALLARHCAVLGTTGSGKSCTVTATIDALLELETPSANIVIFDTNGEYKRAFEGTRRGEVSNVCVVGPDDVPLFVPHWFMDNADHASLLQAGEQAQAPLLQTAVADARLGGSDVAVMIQLTHVIRYLDDLRAVAVAGGRKPQESLSLSCEQLDESCRLFERQARELDAQELAEFWADVTRITGGWTSLDLVAGNDAWDRPITPVQREQLEGLLVDVAELVQGRLASMGRGDDGRGVDFDSPTYYSLQDLHDHYLPIRIQMAAVTEPRVVGYSTTLMMRLARLLADNRYGFMTRVPRFDDALARYLRLLLGVDPITGIGERPPPWSERYGKRHPGARHHSVTILDLSTVASDVLENVAALLARVLFGFAQRVEPRGSFPILLVLEEAHRYVPDDRSGGQLRSSEAFERIAKEGRKYGVSLMLATQRPSELSRTVLSQCGTLVAHKLVSHQDQELVRSATPFAARDVLRQVAGLSRQHAVIIGEAVSAPMLLRVRSVPNPPKSDDPDFVEHWRRQPTDELGATIDTVARKWEGTD
jgi:DNA helicase HerA-like ATPase